MTGTGTGLVGVDPAVLSGWLRRRAADSEPPFAFELITGGRSNLTYRVSDVAGRQWVLRRPPLHSVLPTAHDVLRECRVITALRDTAVPVPPVIGYDADLLDAPFYVMEFVPGVVVRDEETVRATLPEHARRDVALALVDTLVDLHAVDAASVGLADLGRGAGYLDRQLRRWQEQARRQRSRPLPVADRVYEGLRAAVPSKTSTAIVHGDFRLDNVILEPAGPTIEAVLDWELCTLGDPLADLGVFLTYWTEVDDEVRPFPSAPTVADGFPTRQELAERYAQRSGQDVSALPYYLAFGHWRLALVLEGVHARFEAGAYGDVDPSSYDYMPEVVAQLVARAAELGEVRAP